MGKPTNISPDQVAEQVAEMLRPELSLIGDRIEEVMPKGWFFAVMVWPSARADGNAGAYVSNCPCRRHLLEVLRTFIKRVASR